MILNTVLISAYKPQRPRPRRPRRPRQPPKYRAIQISFDGLGSQGKSGDWQYLYLLSMWAEGVPEIQPYNLLIHAKFAPKQTFFVQQFYTLY